MSVSTSTASTGSSIAGQVARTTGRTSRRSSPPPGPTPARPPTGTTRSLRSGSPGTASSATGSAAHPRRKRESARLADDVRARDLRESEHDDLVDVHVRGAREREHDAVCDVLGVQRAAERDVLVDGGSFLLVSLEADLREV